MGILTSAVVGSICKELTKLLVSAATDSKAASAIAGELAGAAGKSLVEKIVPRLVAAYIDPVEGHPEFRNLPEGDREAVRREVVDTVKPALDRDFLGRPQYKPKEIITRLVIMRKHKGSPVDFSADAVSMYEQALDASVRAVIKVAESAPEWHAANAAEVHTKLDRIADSLDATARAQTQVLEVLDFLKQSVADLNASEFNTRREFLELYYRAIRATLDKMELYGLDVQEDHPARSQRLSVAYISLNLTTKGEESDKGSHSWESVLDTLEPGAKGRLLVRGDAGMGKTTLLRWAAIAIAAQAVPSQWVDVRILDSSGIYDPYGIQPRVYWRDTEVRLIEHTWRGKVPLLVVLRECPDGKFPDLDQFPKFVSGACGTPPSGFVRWLLERGKALLMIDGLDEVPAGEPTKQTSKAITELLEAYGDQGNYFIATSRPLVKDPAWIMNLGFREAVIAPMTDPERDALIHKWHTAVAEQTGDEKRRAEIEAMPTDLIQQLNNRAAIARLASVPLLCAMICAQSGPLGSKLPESEFAIINKLAEAMLWVRDRDRAVPRTGTPWDDLQENKRLAVAARLAHFLISQGKAAVPREAAVRKIADALRYAGFSDIEAKRDAPSILTRMSDRGGVVRAPDGGLVEFAHKTFCEFLSAFQFVEDQDTFFLGQYAPQPGPSNVCRFTAGVKNRKYTEELIDRVLEGTDSPDERGVVALRMKLAAPTLDPTVQAKVKKVEDRLIPPTSQSAAKAIADLGDEVVERLSFAAGVSVEHQILNATALSQMRSKKAAAALAAYAPKAGNMHLIELLGRTLNPLLIPMVRRALTKSEDDDLIDVNDTIRNQITDAAIEEWLRTDDGLPNLVSLDLGSTGITAAGAAALADRRSGLQVLTRLYLFNTVISNAGAEALADARSGLLSLTWLDLSSTQITDDGAARLASPTSGLRNLTKLVLRGNPITDSGLAKLVCDTSGLTALTMLDLGFTGVTDEGLENVTRSRIGLQKLTRLSLRNTRVSDAGLTYLAGVASTLNSITELDLRFTRITDVGIAWLADPSAGLRGLTTLWVEGTQVTHSNIQKLKYSRPGIDVRW